MSESPWKLLHENLPQTDKQTYAGFLDRSGVLVFWEGLWRVDDWLLFSNGRDAFGYVAYPADLYAYIVAWFSERQGYQQMILDHDYHMNEHLLAAIGCLVNPRDLPLKTWVRISRDECGHFQVSSSCGYMTGVTKAEFRNPNGGDSMLDKLNQVLG